MNYPRGLLRNARLALLPALLISAVIGFSPAHAASLQVTNTNDNGPGSLRQAITDASSGDTITFAAALSGQTVSLSTGKLTIAKDLTVSGLGANQLSVVRDSGPTESVFEVAAGATAIISGLRISGGISVPGGGGIRNLGTLTLNDSTVSDNLSNFGGGIDNDGTLTINRSLIIKNTASGQGTNGGGIGNFGTLTVNDSIITQNVASSDGLGGGIRNLGPGTLTLHNTNINNNKAFGGAGISNLGTATLIDSTVASNSASGSGGGIDNAGSAQLDRTTVSGNVAGIAGGGVHNASGASLTVATSTFFGNLGTNAGGGIDNGGTLAIQSSTFSLNQTRGSGGGLNNTGSATVASALIATNVNLNPASADDVKGAFASQGFNLLGSSDGGSGFGVQGDQSGTNANPIDPKLGPLASNGGTTLTRILQAGSPAIDAGGSTCPALDQRLLSRPQGAACDVGAVEVEAVVAPTPTPAPAQNLFYAVDNPADKGTSQLFTIDPATLVASPLGPKTAHDFEDVAIVVATHEVFASTGKDVPGDKGNIYRVDGVTGALTLVGASGFDRITIMKFRASDDTLWGWAEGKGLVQFDKNTGKGTLVFKSSKKFEGMAFAPDGKLYLASDTKLSVIDLTANTLKSFASNLPKGTESLAILPTGELLGGVGTKAKPALFRYDIAAKQVVEIKPITTPFTSIEGLCVPSGVALP